MQTNVSHIYAAGDVIGGIQLAHVAFHEGTTAALHASGEDVKLTIMLYLVVCIPLQKLLALV